MGTSMRVLGISCVAMLVVACGSSGGVGDDDAQIEEDSGEGPDVTSGPDASPQKDSAPPQDSTIEVGPTNDATLDVNFGDAIWTADSQGGGGTDAPTDTGNSCSPDGILCNGNTAEICKNGSLSTQVCTNGKVCADGYGCVTCVPGSGTCNGSQASLCNSQGTGYVVSTCDSQLGLTCQAGVCVGDCANIGESYIGCEYYAVTMLNDLLSQSTFPFAIQVANTTSKSAKVTITGPQTVTGNPFTVNANSSVSIVLPWESSLSAPATHNSAFQSNGAYHIKSTEPVTVYQFNARDYQVAGPTYSYTNDASLLIPVNAMTGTYYMAAFPSFWGEPGVMTIVGTQASTSVTVSPSVTITAGGGLATNGGTVVLGAGDVLQVMNPAPTTQAYGGDMSGSKITATAPIEVFGGHGCVYVPAAYGYCDHIEEVMFPYETLQKDYLVVPPNMTGIQNGNRLSAPAHHVRIVGTAANTTLTYQPSPTVLSGSAAGTVNQGGVVAFETGTPFHLTASQPVIVSMVMEGSANYCTQTVTNTCALNGDPGQSVAVATGQFRDNYAFTAPATYYINWATLIAPTGNSVTVDSTTINANQFTAIGASGYGYYHYKICDGSGSPTCGSISANHKASSAAPFGIQVYGYGSYTSYWYPGGLNLTR